MSDLTIEVTLEEPTTGWSVFGFTIRSLCCEVFVDGTSVEAAFDRMTFIGKNTTSDQIFGNNVYNAVIFQGGGGFGPPIGGGFSVRDSAFIEVAAGAVAANARDAIVSVTGSTAERSLWPVQISDLDLAHVTVAGNRLHGVRAGIQIVDGCPSSESLCGFSRTQFVIDGNQLEAFDGVEIMGTFGDGMHCNVAGNRAAYDEQNGGVAVWLGPGTKGCRVVTKGAVRDEGTGNKVIILP